MKQILSLIFTITIITSFSQKVTLSGTINNNTVYDSISLSRFSQSGEPRYLTTIANDGTFSFDIKVTDTYYYKLGLSEKNYVLLILKPGEKVQFSADASDLFQTFKVSGSEHTNFFYEANDAFMEFSMKKDSINKEMTRQLELLELKEKVYSKNFILDHLHSLASLMLIERLDKDEYADVYKKLDSALINEYPTNKMVQDFHAMVQNLGYLSVGSEVPDIMLPDVNGKQISLKNLRGKVVLIDFWATWCAPCKAEIPNLKRAYTMYKEKGFEILSISIDRDKSQWENAIGSMEWLNVFDNGSLVARDFGVQSIPFTILIDEKGKIVAKNLRGAELNMYLADLLMK